MSFKKPLKIVATVFISALCLYLSILISFGGFGKKRLPLNTSLKRDSLLLFAHRGLSGYFPENSLSAIKEAGIQGLNAEIDITRSKDRDLIVFHDENCSRLLGLDKEITTLNTVELKKYPIIFNKQTSNCYITTVKELLRNRKKNMVYYFDMKLVSFKDADDVAKVIKENNSLKSVIVANSDIFFILYMELKYPEITTALEGFDAGKEWTYNLIPKNLKPDYVSGDFMNIDEDHIHWLKKNKMMSRRILYGVCAGNIDFVLLSGFKNIIFDYDKVLETKTLTKNHLGRKRFWGI